ncbi:hypothetical protein D7X33_28665, partial [Butyricicoccus sp. 1XD8-22]
MRVLQWICCPVCGNKTRLQIQADTELKNFPLYCPKCKQESLIDAKNFQITVIRTCSHKSIHSKSKIDKSQKDDIKFV